MQIVHTDPTQRFIAFLLVVIVAGWISVVEVGGRRDAERVALARKLALKAVELREVDAGNALGLGAAAVHLHADDQTRGALADTLADGGRIDLNDVSRSDKVAMTSDGSFVLALPALEKVHRWNLRHGMSQASAAALDFGGSVDTMAMSADGGTVMTTRHYDDMTVWDLGNRSRPAKVASVPLGESVDEVTMTPDGKTALVAYSGLDESDVVTVEVWDLRRKAHPARRSTLKVPGRLDDMAVSSDGKTAVALQNEGAGGIVWDLTDLAHPSTVAELDHKDHSEESVALSHDGRRAVFGTGGGVDVWDLGDRTKPVHRATMGYDFHDVFAVALARDGDLVLAADFQGRAALWDLSQPSRPVRLAALKTGGPGTEAVALSDDGRTAVVGSAVRGPRVWDLSAVDQDPLRSACRQGGVGISHDFRERHLDGQDSEHAAYEDIEPCEGVLAP
ncbi:WD40 repeat domain-containing protein [Streptosporangium sp. NPDC048865]|uniref:WD40 repeat domain-containing protein n=1 Tax=Streptosporangium sp. NPDC048865 TaxID=3155766 RepID=UPI00342D6BBF